MSNHAETGSRKGRHAVLRWRIAVLVLCTLGAALSADLIRLHVKVHTDPGYQSYCAVNEWANCETVAESPHAVAFGLPVAAWGFLAYLAMGVLAAWGIRRPLQPESWPFGLLFWMSTVSVAVSVYMFFISHLIIESVCLVCMGTYLVNLALLGVSWVELRRLGLHPFRALGLDFGALRDRRVSVGLVSTGFIVAAVVLWATVPPYWVVEAMGSHVGFATGETPEGYPWIGAASPTLVISEYSDYQCPHCQRGHDQMRKLISDHSETIRLVHRHYPLDQACNRQLTRPFHPHACAYAKLAYCAEAQDSFWAANDFLFANGRRKQPITASELAGAVGIDRGTLESCLSDGRADAAIATDLETGRSLGIRGTPTFVVGDRTYPGSIPAEVLAQLLAGSESP